MKRKNIKHWQQYMSIIDLRLQWVFATPCQRAGLTTVCYDVDELLELVKNQRE